MNLGPYISRSELLDDGFTYFNVFQLFDSSKTLVEPTCTSISSLWEFFLVPHFQNFLKILPTRQSCSFPCWKFIEFFCQKGEMNLVEDVPSLFLCLQLPQVGVQLSINHIDLLEVLLSVSWLSNLLLNCLPLMEQRTSSVQHGACHLIGWVWRLIHCWLSIHFEKTAFI